MEREKKERRERKEGKRKKGMGGELTKKGKEVPEMSTHCMHCCLKGRVSCTIIHNLNQNVALLCSANEVLEQA